MENKNNIIMFIDNIGRQIFGEAIKENDDTIEVKNPCIINIVQDSNNKIAVQIFPLILFEIFDINNTKSYIFKFRKTDINIALNEDGTYVTPNNNIMITREKFFEMLSNGTLQSKINQNSNDSQILEVK